MKTAVSPDPKSQRPKTASEAAGSSSQSTLATPSGKGDKRKHLGTPASTEPPGKRSYVKTAGSGGVRSALKAPVHILWVLSTLVEKGEVSEGYFNQVISRCHQIKIKGVLKGEAEHMWCLAMHGQPSYDKSNSRGKMFV